MISYFEENVDKKNYLPYKIQKSLFKYITITFVKWKLEYLVKF